MKRIITVAAREGEAIWVEFRNSAASTAGAAAMMALIQKLKQKGIPHHDQQANNEKSLPQQGGYVSFFVNERGLLEKKNH